MGKTTGGGGGDLKVLERVVKGFANHRRIQMLRLLRVEAELSLIDLCRRARTGLKSGAEHLRRAHLGGLIEKRYEGRYVLHKITPLGLEVLAFLDRIE